MIVFIGNFMESSNPFLQRLSPKEKEDYQASLEKWTIHNLPIFKEKISNEIDNDKKHQEIIQLCAKSFADTDLAKATGYEFYFAEPLIEFGGEKKGNHSFDLLLYSESTHRAILISCKSSISNAKSVLIEFEKAKKLVKEKIEYLTRECIGDDLELENIEYVLCVYEKDEAKIIDSLEGQEKKPKKSQKYNPSEVIVWVYHPKSDIIQIHENHSHNNQQLTEYLFKGTGQSDKGSRFDLPYCSTSHSYRILKMAVIGECYAKQQVEGKEDPKIITKEFLMQVLMRNISLGAPIEVKRKIIQERMEQIIEYGKRHDILLPAGDHAFRLNCRGEHIKTVIKSFEEKFINNWTLSKAKKEAQKKAEEEIQKKIYKKTLFDY